LRCGLWKIVSVRRRRRFNAEFMEIAEFAEKKLENPVVAAE